ncbi:Tetracycline resistance protein, class B [Aquisphaera giovannonii]|uniref:Tetracycline resistance protein, class B n=1 Tax=Aquisphaera giovannonii TaxID=406548 RepID=A0A5B9W6L5_9BACT|nr:MFS transporter [Aquisphaera giovannonii]QEH35809.1 Tetracycline resistance protein, class B [Aquisphaera giovannonii]
MSPLAVIVLIVLIDLLGFSVVMPLLAPFAEQYGFADWQIGLLFSAYPLCQLVAGPILGRLSDRYGRRPLLIYSQAGTAISFLILGLSRDFTVMLLARMLDGASGGNILVAQAYVADVTKPADRARGMGLIGMAFGLGFVLGPLLGGLLVGLHAAGEWRLRLPFLVAAGFSTIAWILVLARLPESLPEGSGAREAARVLSWRGVLDAVRLPAIGSLIGIGSLSVLAFAALEGTLALFVRRRFGWDARGAAFAFAGLGLLTAVVQGGLIRRLVPRFGEANLIRAGIFSALAGFAAIALATGWPMLIPAFVLVGVGQGISGPSVSGLLSRLTPTSEQGAVFGTFSSTQTLARMISYSAANVLLGRLSEAAPYWFGCAVYAAAGVTALALLPRVPVQQPAEPAVMD